MSHNPERLEEVQNRIIELMIQITVHQKIINSITVEQFKLETELDKYESEKFELQIPDY